MPHRRLDDDFEQRLWMEIIVDARPEEQSIGWYYYLEEHLRFPFRARCKAERPTSPLRVGDVVDVRGKLGLRSRAQVAAWAVEHALYTP